MLASMFVLLVIVFLVCSSNLLLSLIVLEALSFVVLALFAVALTPTAVSDFLILCLFSVFVMEGVIALSGMITLVSFTGSDFVSSSSVLKC